MKKPNLNKIIIIHKVFCHKICQTRMNIQINHFIYFIAFCLFLFVQVVYLSETAGYIPVTSLRNRPTSINAGYHIDGDIDGWRHESWDRDYSHRNRFNNTRVQR